MLTIISATMEASSSLNVMPIPYSSTYVWKMPPSMMIVNGVSYYPVTTPVPDLDTDSLVRRIRALPDDVQETIMDFLNDVLSKYDDAP